MYAFRPHDPPGACQRCSSKVHLSELRKEWTGLRVCRDCWDPRHPQDFVKGVPEQPLRNPAPEPGDVFVDPEDFLASNL